MAFTLGSSINQTLNSPSLSLTSVFPLSFQASKISTLPYSSSTNIARHDLKLKHLPKTSPKDVTLEQAEDDSKFVPLSVEDPQYGPPALLLLGFELEEIPKIQQFLKELDGEFIQIVCCTEEMITLSLWDAISTNQPNLQEVKIAKSLPRICFLSGLSGEEMIMFIDAFPEIGLEPTVFAALVPNSADKPVAELIEEIMGDHEMLTAKNVSSPEPLPST